MTAMAANEFATIGKVHVIYASKGKQRQRHAVIERMEPA